VAGIAAHGRSSEQSAVLLGLCPGRRQAGPDERHGR
jgi:hypothetical protein